MTNLTTDDFVQLVRMAIAEDLGSGDITTDATVTQGQTGQATIVQKSPGCIYGHDVATAVFAQMYPG
ncbi:MAG: hypothetical protein JHC87_09575, partial [Thermoleophilaceae bacterium]|nr:hypothetical protein [Thermoleophilaceae bacterium]